MKENVSGCFLSEHSVLQWIMSDMTTRSAVRVPRCQKIKKYTWWLNPVWHRMPYKIAVPIWQQWASKGKDSPFRGSGALRGVLLKESHSNVFLRTDSVSESFL